MMIMMSPQIGRTFARNANLFTRHIVTSARSQYSTRFAQQTFPTFTKSWLSDPSVYPLFVIVGGTLAVCFGAGVHALTTYEDVRIRPSKRNSILRYWGGGGTSASTSTS
eukprot:893028_1